jgi:hypothetical protein
VPTGRCDAVDAEVPDDEDELPGAVNDEPF